MNQSDIVKEMRVLPQIDVSFEIDRRINFIKSTLLNSGAKCLILGISGGIDSSTLGRLAQLATEQLNQENQTDKYKFIAVR
ncbi:MAG: hypothetical protein V2I33_10620, partial [Kangiellaceae bacterium]|nr:hypothetical protein [Kangiellaceae bacterium]